MKKAIFLFYPVIFCICCNNNQVNKGIKKWELTPDIFIIDKEKSIESLDALTGYFKDKTVYIDRWATWCSPCIEEFKYNDSLHTFLKDNKIEIVYLNSDKEISDSIFYDFIKSHNLRGYHLRLNDKLKEDLARQKIFIPLIPQYIIVNKHGVVVTNKAFRPSDGDKLYSQLKLYRNN